MEEENKKVTRRKFLEDSSKKALAGTAAAFLGLSMIRPKDVQAAGCLWSCSGGCSASCGGCTGQCTGCTGSCEGDCVGSCSSNCSGQCAEACTNSCSGECRTTGYSAQAKHGTPVVIEREVSSQRVIV